MNRKESRLTGRKACEQEGKQEDKKEGRKTGRQTEYSEQVRCLKCLQGLQKEINTNISGTWNRNKEAYKNKKLKKKSM